MTEAEAEAAYLAKLAEKGMSKCPFCGHTIGLGDLAWNNGWTDAGTDYTVVEIQCTVCQTEIVNFHSWWPGAENFVDLVENVILDDGDWPS